MKTKVYAYTPMAITAPPLHERSRGDWYVLVDNAEVPLSPQEVSEYLYDAYVRARVQTVLWLITRDYVRKGTDVHYDLNGIIKDTYTYYYESYHAGDICVLSVGIDGFATSIKAYDDRLTTQNEKNLRAEHDALLDSLKNKKIID